MRAFTALADRESLLAALAEAERAPPNPLRGCPIGVKDLIDTVDFPTAYGSEIYDGHIPVRDAAIVSALRGLGALIVGKTATSEFATWLPTSTRNPRAPGCTPGGSSAGSAAAVAAGLVPLALGTQTLGSVIRPASYCGVVGFKPSFGRLPIAGVKPLAESLDTVGLLGESVDIIASAYALLARSAASAEFQHRPRLGVVRNLPWAGGDAYADAALLGAAAALRAGGIPVTEIQLPGEVEAADSAARQVHLFEMARTLLPDLMRGGSRLDRSLADAIAQGQQMTAATYEQARATIEKGRMIFAELMHDYDALLCLAATGEAPAGHASTGDPAMNRVWTALHLPCLTLPVLHGANGFPIGLQMIGAYHADTLLLEIARLLELSLPPRINA